MEKLYNLEYDFVKQDRNYMVFSKEDGLNNSQLNNIQAKMLLFNNIPNLLQLELEEMNFNIKLRYDVTSKINLAYFLKTKELSTRQCIRIFSSIISILNESKLYMLGEKNYIIHQDFIFIDVDTMDIFFVYLPLKDILEKETYQLELQKLLIHIFNNTNNTDDILYNKIINLSVGTNYDIADLKYKLRLLSLSNDDSNKDNLSNKNVQNDMIDNSFLKPISSLKKIIIFTLSILLIVFIWSRYIENQDEGLLYISLGFTILVMDFVYVILKIWRPKLKRIKNGSLIGNEISAQKKITKSIPSLGVGIDETTLLNNNNNIIYLEVDRGTEIEKININNKSFIIGRNKKAVNYFEKSNDISRIHLEIINDATGYLIKDLGSKNGSYLNGDALVSNKIYPIKDNDIIKLARTEFLVKEVSYI